MSLKDDILKTIKTNPIGFRAILQDAKVNEALNDIGVLPKILELHLPSPSSRRTTGLGNTACGIRGTLHPNVTCERCKKMKLS